MTRPLILVGGMWVSLLLIAVVAIGGLLSPGASEHRSVSTTIVGSDSEVAIQPAPQQARVPLWMFGAIALTCTAGSILVSRQLNRPPVPPRRLARTKSRSFKRLPPQPMAQLALPPAVTYSAPLQPSRQELPARSPQPRAGQKRPHSPAHQAANLQPVMPPTIAQAPAPARPIERQVLPPLLKQPAKAKPIVQPQTVASRPTVKTSVSILPPDIRKPLDWQSTELADAVDLRKRRSLSSLL
ncbi:MAG TPA: hypothetical protein V6C64_07785 [Microcoleaceae cyanobacterium]